MTLEELLQAWKAAKAKAQANPTDKALEKLAAEAEQAYNDKKSEVENGGEGGTGDHGDDDDKGGDDGEFDESSADEKTKKYIAKLRQENAKHRTKSKEALSKLTATVEQKKQILKVLGLEDDEKPEEKLQKLTVETQTKDFRLAILESALQNGVPKDQLDYYEYLVTKAVNELEEGEELDDDSMAAIVGKVKAVGGSKKANTSVGGGEGGKTPPKPGSSEGEVTYEKFLAMGVIARSKFFEKNPDLCKEFMTRARSQKKLV